MLQCFGRVVLGLPCLILEEREFLRLRNTSLDLVLQSYQIVEATTDCLTATLWMKFVAPCVGSNFLVPKRPSKRAFAGYNSSNGDMSATGRSLEQFRASVVGGLACKLLLQTVAVQLWLGERCASDDWSCHVLIHCSLLRVAPNWAAWSPVEPSKSEKGSDATRRV